VQFWDLVTGDEIALAEQLQAHDLAFSSPGELVTLNRAELATIRVSNEGPDQSLFRIGPAKRLNVGSFAGFTCSTDGTTLAQAMFGAEGVPEGVSVFVRRDGEWVRRRFDAHVLANGAVVSPDGTMITTPSFHDKVKTRVWATSDGRQLAAYDTWDGAAIAFSPNNRWLAIGSNALSRIIPVGDWERGMPFDGGHGKMCFSPSSDLLAVETGTGAVQCFDPETGRKLVRFEEPNQNKAECLIFTPDGTRLVAISDESKAIHVWDLRLIREEPRELGLDWDAAPFPPAPREDGRPKPRLRIEFEPPAPN
jgi:WD40 repeat protein